MKHADEEDVVHYAIYSSKADECLEDLLNRCLPCVVSQMTAYIWHDEPFSLEIDQEKRCLKGRTHYGDNVEDEWFVVALLIKITKEVRNTVVRVTDQDGEVLLIEAANELPRWAQEPDVAAGRVFIHDGQVHLLPISERPSDLSPFPAGAPNDIAKAAQVVADHAFNTRASDRVQETVMARLKSFPNSWEDNLHYLHVRLPVKAARLLHQSPQLISGIVHRLLDSDPDDIKSLRAMETFPPTDLIETGVHMTKCLYAMLSSKSCWPAKGLKWSLPPQQNPNFNKAIDGFKLAAGMELLAHDTKERADKMAPKVETALVNRLTDLGYFRDLLPGSKEYNALLAEAQLFFADKAAKEDPKLSLFKECLKRQEDFASAEETARPSRLTKPADGQEWLQHDQESMDQLLEAHFGLKASEGDDGLMHRLSDFLDAESDLKGVEHDLEDLDKPIKAFNADEFQVAMEKMVRIASGLKEGNDESSEDEEEKAVSLAMEEELLKSNVKDGRELMEAFRNLTTEMNETPTGPTRTLLNSLKK